MYCVDVVAAQYLTGGGDDAFQHSHDYLGENSVVVEIGILTLWIQWSLKHIYTAQYQGGSVNTHFQFIALFYSQVETKGFLPTQSYWSITPKNCM